MDIGNRTQGIRDQVTPRILLLRGPCRESSVCIVLLFCIVSVELPSGKRGVKCDVPSISRRLISAVPAILEQDSTGPASLPGRSANECE